jgi:protein involved in polysaccharide export with SLBB domain
MSKDTQGRTSELEKDLSTVKKFLQLPFLAPVLLYSVHFLLISLVFGASGCSTVTFRIKGVPACSLPTECRAESKRNLVPIDVTQLAQSVPEKYVLGAGDVIGVSVDGIMPIADPNGDPRPIPVHFPEASSGLPPAIGVPVVVQESGTVTLTGLEPLDISGQNLEEAADTILKAYQARNIIKEGESTYPVVTIIRKRVVNVTVIREDTGSTSREENIQDARGSTIQLPAFNNDVLHALMITGGLPGLRAKNEIRIYRNRQTAMQNASDAVLIIGSMDYSVATPSTMPDEVGDGPDIVIPMRVQKGMRIEIAPEDVILNEGDVVYIANRDTEVFYTAGMLPGGEHLLPRDYDIDIFEAMAIAGYSYGNSSQGGGMGIPSSGIAPTQLFVFREREDGTEYTIAVDLESALADDCERILVKPGDKLLLRFSPKEETLNFGIFAFFTYGIRQLFR